MAGNAARRKVGASTGTTLVGVRSWPYGCARRRSGPLVTLLCDSGERYLGELLQSAVVTANIGDISPWQAQIADIQGEQIKKPDIAGYLVLLAGISLFGGIR